MIEEKYEFFTFYQKLLPHIYNSISIERQFQYEINDAKVLKLTF